MHYSQLTKKNYNNLSLLIPDIYADGNQKLSSSGNKAFALNAALEIKIPAGILIHRAIVRKCFTLIFQRTQSIGIRRKIEEKIK